jgi:hypothetical protein
MIDLDQLVARVWQLEHRIRDLEADARDANQRHAVVLARVWQLEAALSAINAVQTVAIGPDGYHAALNRIGTIARATVEPKP